MKIKAIEKKSYEETAEIKNIKDHIIDKVRPELMDIVSFLMKPEIKPYQNLMLSLFR